MTRLALVHAVALAMGAAFIRPQVWPILMCNRQGISQTSN